MTGAASSQVLWTGFVSGFFAPAERLKPSEWCEKNLILPAGYSETDHGPVRFERSPYLRKPLDALHRPGVVSVALAAPTRLGKTFLLRMAFGFAVAGDPGPVILIDSTVEKGRGLVKKELIPVIEHNRVLRERKPVNRHHFTTTEMLFPGASVNVYGANSERQVAGDTARYVLGNEVAKWRGATEEEASILELVAHRTESYDDLRRHCFSSTPTTEDNLFWLEMQKGTMEVYRVPCLDCGDCFAIAWEMAQWAPEARMDDGRWNHEEVVRTARLVCPGCGSRWDDRMRLASVHDPRAEWEPTQKGLPGHESYQLNGFYGRRKVNRIGQLCSDFLKARERGFVTDRQDFWNSRMGMVYRHNLQEIQVKRLSVLERDYFRGKVPAGMRPDVGVLAWDCQTWGMPWVFRVFSWSGESWLVDHGVAPGWEDLAQVQMDYGSLARSYAIGDVGFEARRTEALEQILARLERGWLASSGADYSAERVKVQRANVWMGGKLQKENVTVPELVISTYDFKMELWYRFRGDVKNWWIYSLPLAAGNDEVREYAEYKEQLLDERLYPRKRRRRGMPEMEFRARSGKNHFFDCEVQALALFWLLQKKRSFVKRQPPARRSVNVKRGEG